MECIIEVDPANVVLSISTGRMQEAQATADGEQPPQRVGLIPSFQGSRLRLGLPSPLTFRHISDIDLISSHPPRSRLGSLGGV